jgi:hypothetical protein
MEEKLELEAYDALAKHARLADLVVIARSLATSAVEKRSSDWRAASHVKALAEERKLDAKDGSTDVGDALSILEVGPTSRGERAVLAALWAHAIAESPPRSTEDEDRLAKEILWLAAHTPFDATPLLDRALGEDAGELWTAIAERIKRADGGEKEELGRGEVLVGAAALGASSSPSAAKQAATLATGSKDIALLRLLRPDVVRREPTELAGEVHAAPRGPAATTLLALSGLLFVIHVARLSARAALGYRKPATVTISETGARVRWRTEILGRTVRDRDVVMGREGLASALREVRYPRASFYAGLFFLVLGSFVGVRTLADGVRAASPSLLLTGLVFVAVGILLDFALGSLVPGSSGRCRVIFVPRAGSPICVAGVDAARADLALAILAAPPSR